MSMKLRDLIRSVRACKTAAEERAVIAKECANIRTSFKEKDNPYRHRNVAKLLYIHMLGYPTHFGQMEAMRLVASPSFPEKRIGYLGLMILLDEKQKILMLVTNSIKQDFTHSNPYIVGLAICALGNICNNDMAKDLSNEIVKLCKHSNAYIRKKAILCANRLIKKVPELIEEYEEIINSLLNDKNHAVILATATLIITIIQLDPSSLKRLFSKLTSTITRLLKNLVMAGFISEYDVAGLTDPYLQCKLIELLRLLARNSAENSEICQDILAQVAINTEAGNKNAANAILYEAVLCIMSIQSDQQSRTLGINILGRFLQSGRDNNIKYVALQALHRCVDRNQTDIQRHRQTIVECLKDADIRIRKRALDLIYALVTKQNVKALVKELVNYLSMSPSPLPTAPSSTTFTPPTTLQSADAEFRADLCEKICNTASKFSANKQWYVDTIVTVLTLSGNATKEKVSTDFISLITRSQDARLQTYATLKLASASMKALQNKRHPNQEIVEQDSKKIPPTQLPLIHVTLWCVGEYGELLLQRQTYDAAIEMMTESQQKNYEHPTEQSILEFLQAVKQHPESTLLTRQYLLNTLAKLTSRLQTSDSQSKLLNSIQEYSHSISVELQQRSCEYTQLLVRDNLSNIRKGLLARMPIQQKKTKEAEVDKTKSDEETEESEEEEAESEEQENEEDNQKAIQIPKGNLPKKKQLTSENRTSSANLLDLDILGASAVPVVPVETPTNANNLQQVAQRKKVEIDLMDLFSSQNSETTPTASQSQSLDLFGGISNTNTNNAFILSGAAPDASQPGASLNELFGGTPTATTSSQTWPPVQVFCSQGLTISFSFERQISQPHILYVTAHFSNSNPVELTNLDFQVAVLKHVKLEIFPPNSNTIPSSSHDRVQQKLTLTNSLHGQKKLVIKVKIDYRKNGQQITEQAQINQFPD